MGEVVQLVLMRVGLSLEADGAISGNGVSEASPPPQPLEEVEQVKTDVSHLTHLRRMDGFVTDGAIRDRLILPASKDVPEEVYRRKATEWDKAVVDDLHAPPSAWVRLASRWLESQGKAHRRP